MAAEQACILLLQAACWETGCPEDSGTEPVTSCQRNRQRPAAAGACRIQDLIGKGLMANSVNAIGEYRAAGGKTRPAVHI